MPRPTFDIEQYELRGELPKVYTPEQQRKLNEVLARVNGQIDWTAQLLGFSGTKVWGRPNPRADGKYDWTGLPSTMNEKRQMQVGAFGVYNKDQDYEEWPSPFNRSEIKASGDARVHVFERDGHVILSPLGQGEEIDFMRDPVFFVGGSYVFDREVELAVTGVPTEDFAETETFYVSDQIWTRATIKDTSETLTISIVGSKAAGAPAIVLDWEDISDWNVPRIPEQFLGIWGNKGASLSFDHAFDALDLHGFDEQFGLKLIDFKTCFTLTELLERVGLEPTEWTPYAFDNLGIKVGDCTISYPRPPYDVGDLYDNGDWDDPVPPQDLLDGGDFDALPPLSEIAEEGIYERVIGEDVVILPNDFEFFKCDLDCGYVVSLTQNKTEIESCPKGEVCPGTPEYIPGISNICIQYEVIDTCSIAQKPCIEWVFDPTLDNGLYEAAYFLPTNPGPWATANDGEYDEVPTCYDGISIGASDCDYGEWCGFDDGIFDEKFYYLDEDDDPEQIEIICAADEPAGICDPVDGGLLTVFGPPNYEDCDCSVECCLVDNGLYNPNLVPPAFLGLGDGTGIIDGGITEGQCVIYDNNEYEFSGEVSCDLDNGLLEDPVSSTFADSTNYDRILTECIPCTDDDDLVIVPCPTDPIYVSLNSVFGETRYEMLPTIRNSLTPLRVWKSRVLTVADELPPSDTEYWNFLIADENKGPEPENSFRYFIRLPLEYTRNGKEWNRAVAVSNNLGYFSAPPNLSQTEADPPNLRPPLYSAEYWRKDVVDYIVFYDEDYLVSTRRDDFSMLQEGFTDSAVTYEADEFIPYMFAELSEYDPYDLRAPNEDGSWKGHYYKKGVLGGRTGFIETDLANDNIRQVEDDLRPIYDKSYIELPNVEFPDAVDQAALKNYVVSYAYFVADFSAADDPVFDPEKPHCWRSPAVSCGEHPGGSDDCVPTCYSTNTAYLLHEFADDSCTILI
jgi:hypothetical protein